MKTSSTIRAFNRCFLLAFGLAFWTSAVRAQTPISCGEVISSTITMPTQPDVYQYVSNGQPIVLSHSGCGSPWLPQADFYNTNGQLVVTISLCPGATNLTLAAGAYMIYVHDHNYNEGGTYWMGIQSPLGSCGTTPITCGEVISSNIAVVAKVDAYEYVSNGQPIVLSHSGCGSPWLPQADFYNTNGQLVVTISLCPGATNLTLAAGAYTILVHDDNYNEGGPYWMGIQSPLGSCGTTPITCGEVISSNIAVVAKVDAYEYVSNGQPIVLSHSGCGSPWLPQADFYNTNGQLVVTISLCPGATNLTLAAGAYTILVHDDNYNEGGPYWMGIQSPLGSCGTTPITCGEVISSNIAVVAKVDAYEYVSNGQPIVLSHSGCGSPWLPQADFYNTNGQLVVTISLCPGATNLTLAAGAYTILVHDDNYNEGGPYWMGIQSPVGGGCDPVSVTCGQTLSGDISQPAEIDAYLINGCSGEVVQLSTSGFGGSQFDLYDPTGTKLFSIGPSTATNITFSVSGIYTLLVHSGNYTGTGSYSATFTCFVVCNHTTSTSSSPPNGGATSGGGTYLCCFPVTVCAEPAPCYNFVNWTLGGNPVSTSICYTFVATNNSTLTANFAPTGGTTNQICNFQVFGSNAVISGQSVHGDNYQLQTRTSVTTGSWANISGVVLSNSPGGLIILTNFNGAVGPQKFYRLDITP